MRYTDAVNMTLLGTKLNHMHFDMGKQVDTAIAIYFDGCIKDIPQDVAKKNFYRAFSSEIGCYGLKLRDTLSSAADRENLDTALALLDIFYKYSQAKLNDPGVVIYDKQEMARFSRDYENAINYYRGNIDVRNSEFPLNDIRGNIYRSPLAFSRLFLSPNPKEKSSIEAIASIYCGELDKKDILSFTSIQDMQISKTAQSVLSNCSEFGLKASLSGQLLNGKISIATDRGYKEEDHVQQDAALSVAKSEDCFLNVIADGAGGMRAGEVASKAIVNGLKEWFDDMDEENLKSFDESYVRYMLNEKLIQINNEIHEKQERCCSTVAFALTFGDKTLIGNIGDSMVYGYDEYNDALVPYTTLDSYSRGLSYEDARRNPYNRYITASVGGNYVNPGTEFMHSVVIPNQGQHLLLASDGVIDLTSERNLKNDLYFRRTAEQIVRQAATSPDLGPDITKTQDNISAIVVDLPKSEKSYGGRR